jgi:polygalacturonase
VVFPAGEYVLSTVFLKSGVRIEVTEDALLLGSLDFSDYAPHEPVDYPLYQDASHSFFHTSMFVAENCTDIAVTGDGTIDMRSVWDDENVRDMAHRGAKCIALKNCRGVEIAGLDIQNVTDLAVYFAGCEDVEVHHLTLRVYIDGISPDNCRNVRIHDCDIESGDDGIVFKSSYTLNRLGVCEDIRVWNCNVRSRCNALKFGTETNGGFQNILLEDIRVFDVRIAGIAIESVDGAIVDGITIRNVKMRNVNAPIFVHVGRRMRGPEGRQIGKIKNVTLENITAEGPYEPYEIVAWNYFSYKAGDNYQYPWVFGVAESFDDTKAGNTEKSDWQMTSNVCGLPGHLLENITIRNVYLKLDGGVQSYKREVPEEAQDYPEVYVYGRILPAKGIYFRHINGLTLDNVRVETYRDDKRVDFVFDDVR